MYSQFLQLLVILAPLLPLSNCMLTPNDIPDKWKTSVSLAWDNAVVRSRDVLDLEAYHNWALDQIMDGNGYVEYGFSS